MSNWSICDIHDIYEISNESISFINDANDLYLSECTEVKRHNRLCKLAKNDVVNNVRSLIRYNWAMLFIKDAKEWMTMINSQIDKRKKYPERDGYNELLRHLKNIFNCDTLQIIDIITYGYNAYGYRIEFITGDDYIYLLAFPDTSKYDIMNMSEFELGKCKFGYKVQRDYMKFIAHSYNPCDFRELITEIQTNEDFKVHYTYDEFLKEKKEHEKSK